MITKEDEYITKSRLELFGNVQPHEYENCKTLESVSIWGADKIGEYAFAGCTNLREVSITGGLEIIEDYAFFNCSALQSIVIPDCARIEKHAFDGAFSSRVPGESVNLYLSEEEKWLINIEKGILIEYKGNDPRVVIPDGVITVDNDAFCNCKFLQSVVVPDSIRTIGRGAFRGCTNLSEVTLSNGLLIINAYAFSGCKQMKSITIPDSVTKIEENAFSCFSDFIIHGKKGSETERYAMENGIAFEVVYDE